MEEVYKLINNFDTKELFIISIPMIILIIAIVIISKLYNKHYNNKKIIIPRNKINKTFNIYSDDKK
jgi:regulatory protein YycI of two-component signal transduction system YycFG